MAKVTPRKKTAKAAEKPSVPLDIPARQWHAAIWQQWSQQRQAGRLHHAYLVDGLEGLGKRALATAAAKFLLCNNHEGDTSCDNCSSCDWFEAGSHPDFYACEIEEGARQVKIDQIREIIRRSVLTQSESDHQLFIINDAERMTTEAANALLKTLEEPPSQCIFLLVANSVTSLPATILSRCQRVLCQPPAVEMALTWLQTQSTSNGASLVEYQQALTMADGAPTRALELIENESVKVFDQLQTDLVAMVDGRAMPTLVAAQWQLQPLAFVIASLQKIIRANLWGLHDVPENELQNILGSRKLLTVGVDSETLIAFSDQLNKVKQLIESNVKAELLMEQVAISWCQLQTKNTQRFGG